MYSFVRRTTNEYSHGPVENVQSSQIRCYEASAGSNGAGTKNVKAGDTVGFRVDPSIQHPGPLVRRLSFSLNRPPPPSPLLSPC